MTTQEAYTPTNWHMDGSSLIGDGEPVAALASVNTHVWGWGNRANIIGAAPDLLEALELMLKASYTIDGEIGARFNVAVWKAQDAINKARGTHS